MSFFKKHHLLALVFLTGASVLVIEVVALRVLAPYFGNTIFTASSVIGVILAALSVGYYVGGRLADRHPSNRWFYGIILLSGGSVLVLQLLTLFTLPWFGYRFSLMVGPFVAALFLFLVPGVLLGMLSPFVIKLQERNRPDQGIGSISGTVFFWSTLGSICGSFFAGFYLIPRFGVDRILLGVGILLIGLGLPWVFSSKSILKRSLVILFGVAMSASIVSAQPVLQYDSRTVFVKDGIYERLYIYDDVYEGRPTRFFVQDQSSSGAMFLDSDEHVFDYTKYYKLHEVFDADVDRALVIGGGIFTIPKSLIQDLPEVVVDVVEIEPSLVELAQTYFSVPETDRLRSFIQDGRRFLYEQEDSYDFIFGDAYRSLFSVPTHFTTQEFFELAHDRLSEDGIIVLNLIGSLSRQKPSFLFSEVKTLQSVFPNSHVFAATGSHVTDQQNVILVGVKGKTTKDQLLARLEESSDPFLNTLSDKYIDLERFDFSSAELLTDNYAPVDFLIARQFRRSNKPLFSGKEMLALIEQQLNYGPRYLSSSGRQQVQHFLRSELAAFADDVTEQSWEHILATGETIEMQNIVGRFFPEREQRILLGTHYDSKRFADKDSRAPEQPVPGANDSASGVAVLLETARMLRGLEEAPEIGIDIVFFDGEEGEEHLELSGWKPIGSTYFAQQLDGLYKDLPIKALVVDMVCDEDLDLEFVTDAILDDHTALEAAGIPSQLLIDFDYPYFHTTKDTLDKCSAESLETSLGLVWDFVTQVR